MLNRTLRFRRTRHRRCPWLFDHARFRTLLLDRWPIFLLRALRFGRTKLLTWRLRSTRLLTRRLGADRRSCTLRFLGSVLLGGPWRFNRTRLRR